MENQDHRSKSESLGENNQENVEGFQKCLSDILKAIKDGKFSEMTAETYDAKKSVLTKQLTELSHLHHDLIKKQQHLGSSDSIPPTCFHAEFSPNGGFYLSKKENIANLEQELVSLDGKLQSLRDEKSKLKNEIQEIESKMQSQQNETAIQTENLEKIPNLEKELVSLNEKLQSLTDENSKLKDKIQENESNMQSQKNEIKLKTTNLETEKEKVVDLKKQVADLKKLNYNTNRKIKTMEQELKASNESYQIKELNTKISQYKSEISKLEKNDQDLNCVIKKLRNDLKEECKLAGHFKMEFDKVRSRVEAMEASQITQRRQAGIRVISLQDDRVRVVSSFDNVQNLANEVKKMIGEIGNRGR